MSARDPNLGASRLGERAPSGAVATSAASTIIGEATFSGAPPPDASARPAAQDARPRVEQQGKAARELVFLGDIDPVRRKRLELELASLCDPRARREVARLASRRAYLKQELLLPRLKPLFGALRLLYTPAAALLALATQLHALLPGH